MANSHVLISSQTLGSTASSVTFTSIASTWRDLRLVCYFNNLAGDIETIYLNGDTTWANYSRVAMIGDGGSATSTTASDPRIMESSGYGVLTIDLLDYSATDKHKTGIARGNSASFQVRSTAFRWSNTSAVNSLQLLGTFTTGCSFYLYGVLG